MRSNTPRERMQRLAAILENGRSVQKISTEAIPPDFWLTICWSLLCKSQNMPNGDGVFIRPTVTFEAGRKTNENEESQEWEDSPGLAFKMPERST